MKEVIAQPVFVCEKCGYNMAIERMKPGKPSLIVWCCRSSCEEVNHRYVVALERVEVTPFEKYHIKPSEIRKGQRTYTT